MKRADRSNHPTPLQAAWIERLRQNGYLVVVATADEAIAAIAHYLSVEAGNLSCYNCTGGMTRKHTPEITQGVEAVLITWLANCRNLC